MKIGYKNSKPKANPIPLPNALANLNTDSIPATIFTNGIMNKTK